MNFEQAFFDELEKIAAGAGAYLPGGEASKFLARARATQAGHRSKRGLIPYEDYHHVDIQKGDWAKLHGHTKAPSETTGIRRLEPLPDPRLPGAPSLPFSQRVRGMVGRVAGRVGFGMRTGLGGIGQGIRKGVGRIGQGIGQGIGRGVRGVGSFWRSLGDDGGMIG